MKRSSSAFDSLSVGSIIRVPWTGKDKLYKHVHAAAPDGGDGSRERPFKSIKAAFNACSAGATIYVWKGTYMQPEPPYFLITAIVVNKTVSLIGNGTENTTIQVPHYNIPLPLSSGEFATMEPT